MHSLPFSDYITRRAVCAHKRVCVFIRVRPAEFDFLCHFLSFFRFLKYSCLSSWIVRKSSKGRFAGNICTKKVYDTFKQLKNSKYVFDLLHHADKYSTIWKICNKLLLHNRISSQSVNRKVSFHSCNAEERLWDRTIHKGQKKNKIFFQLFVFHICIALME